MKNKKLDMLVDLKLIKSYVYENTESSPGSGMMESEVLLIVFNDFTTLKISGQCSGSMNNTTFWLE